MAQANIAVIGAGLIGRKHIFVPSACRDGMMTLASTLAISEAARIAFTRTGGCDAEQMIQTR